MPEADAGDCGEGEEHTEGNAQAPDSFELEAGDAICIHPLKLVALGELDIVEERVDEIGGVAVLGECLAGEVADRAANNASNDNASDEGGSVGGSGDQHGEHRIPVQDVTDDNVHDSQAGDYQSADQSRGRVVLRRDHFGHKVGCEADDGDERDELHATHGSEGHA